jgi:hypothetical protein
MNITPQQIVAWFRQQAENFNKMADTVEATFIRQGNLTNGVISPQASLPKMGSVTIEQIRSRLAKKSARVVHLAHEFNVEETQVRSLINASGSGVKMKERGWLYLE